MEEKRPVDRLVGKIAKVFLAGRLLEYYAAIATGLIVALAAVLLKFAVHEVETRLSGLVDVMELNYLYFFLPLAGIALTVLFTSFVVKEDIGHGVAKILKSIARNDGKIRKRNMWASLVACTLTVGFGGSAGLEAPIMYTGSAIGSNLSRFLKFDAKTRLVFVGCGAAAAISAIFKAPIAGVVFVLEVLMLNSTVGNKLPLLVAAVTAAIASRVLTGTDIEFPFSQFDAFNAANVPLYAFLGVVCGLVALYFHRVNIAVENVMAKIKVVPFRVLLGGVALGLMILVFPPLFGEGFMTVKALLSGHSRDILANSPLFSPELSESRFLLFAFCLLLLKPFATAVTTGSGGIGGVFAPSLFMGGLAGSVFSGIAIKLGASGISVPSFTLVGMGGLVAALMHSPLTGVFLIAEVTGGYSLFIPLIVTSLFAFGTHRAFSAHSIYAERLAREKSLPSDNKDKSVLSGIDFSSLLDDDRVVFSKADVIESVALEFSRTGKQAYPVIDEQGKYSGDVKVQALGALLLDAEWRTRLMVDDAAIRPFYVLTLKDSPETVLSVFEKTGETEVPFVDSEGRWIGYLSQAKALALYRDEMILSCRDFLDKER